MLRIVTLIVGILFSASAWAQDSYLLNPGDILEISLWKEETMRRQVVVLPDGTISYPLAGHVHVTGRTAEDVEKEITDRLKPFYEDPFLSVSVVETRGNQVFVLGAVRTPGAFIAAKRLDVMQALSLAGGLNEFADEGKIVVIRRTGDGQQTLPFNYDVVESGRDLSQNVVLQSGDVLVVPTAGIF